MKLANPARAGTSVLGGGFAPRTREDEAMSSNQNHSGDQPQNQNNEMSDDPGDGGRKAFATGRDGASTPAEKAPDAQDQSAIEAFGEEGAGIAPKE
jgi:hypothetical protein